MKITKNDLRKISNEVYDEIKEQGDSEESVVLAIADATIIWKKEIFWKEC